MDSLNNMCDFLKKFHKQDVIVIVDEIDAP